MGEYFPGRIEAPGGFPRFLEQGLKLGENHRGLVGGYVPQRGDLRGDSLRLGFRKAAEDTRGLFLPVV